MEVHQEAMSVAYVPQDQGAEVPYLGTLSTRQADLDPMSPKRPSKANPLIFVYEAGPCGYGLSRYRTQKGYDGGVVAPSLIPHQAGDRVQTDRRDAGPGGPVQVSSPS